MELTYKPEKRALRYMFISGFFAGMSFTSLIIAILFTFDYIIWR